MIERIPSHEQIFATIGREQILKIDFGNILPVWEKDFSDAKEILKFPQEQ